MAHQTEISGAKKRTLREGSLTGFGWSLSGSGLESILKILVLAVLARLLTPADFGILGAALIVVGVSEIFCFIGVAPAVVQRSELETGHIQTAWTLSLLLGILFTALVYGGAHIISGFFRMEGLTQVLKDISWVFTIHGISLVAKALLQRDLEFKRLAICEFASFVTYAVVGISMALLGFGVESLVGAYVSSAGVQAALVLLIKPHSKSIRIDRRSVSELTGLGLGFSLSSILNYAARQGDNLVVGRWLGSSALGAYGRAYALMTTPVTIAGQVMDRVLFSTISRVQDNKKQMVRAFRSVTIVVALITIPASAIAFVAAPELITVLLGQQWNSVVAPFQVLVAGMFFRVAYKISGSINRGIGAVYQMVWRQGVYAVIIIVGARFTQGLGLQGVAGAVLIGVVVNYMLSTALTIRLIDFSWRELFSILFRIIMLAGFVSVCLYGLAGIIRGLSIPVTISLAVLLMTGVVLVSGCLRLGYRWFLDDYTMGILKDLVSTFLLRKGALSTKEGAGEQVAFNSTLVSPGPGDRGSLSNDRRAY